MSRPVWAAAAHRSDAGSHRSAVPEVTFDGRRIAIDAGSAQHVAMREFFRNLLQPLNLAGFFTIGAVALSLRFTHRDVTPYAVLTLLAFTAFFTVLGALDDHRKRLRTLFLWLMLTAALVQIRLAPALGTAQILLVIWVACAFSVWRPRTAVLASLGADVIFYLLISKAGFTSPLTMVLINVGFQALAALCVHYAVSAESARDRLALVNADLLATRALLADSARDAERLRVARELHDVAGHKLTAMRLNLRALATDPTFGEREEVRIAERLSGELLADIRSVVQALRNEHGLDLETALRALAAPLPRPELALRIEDDVRVTDPGTAETLLRLVQEALTNAARHADANRLSVHLRREGAEVVLHMEDDGRIKGAIREGNGIAGMRERIAALRGRFELGATPRGGLRIDARLPA
ncbi:MAG: histidine kinase [Pseudoxanthomonas sp.]